ncbi:MAG: hemerythrin domain-containing protein [Dissulfurispiraceae bacterium]
MKPRGPLMIEHRLIEKMLDIVKKQSYIIGVQDKVDPVFIDTVVDFIKTYADRTHHGKEEDIMFKVLATKNMNAEDEKVMRELADEHIYARKLVTELVQAKMEYLGGRRTALKTIKEKLDTLVKFYPVHIAKEDKLFFPSTEKYLSYEEQESMLRAFEDFDRDMIHEKYKKEVDALRAKK